MIKVKGVSKSYGSTLAVDNVSFSVSRGEIVGFLGPNGAGKTTMMKVLTCFLAPSSGTASVAGHDVIDEPLAVRRSIGYLPENTPLYEEMGVLGYLRHMGQLRGVPHGQLRSRIDDLIDICGIETMAHKDIAELSKGFRQRVGLAEALLSDPPVLILDEPTGGLDPGQIVEIRQLIKDIAREKAIILSTHILPEAQNTCNRILIINEGALVGEGTNEELLEMASGEEHYSVTLKGDAAIGDVAGSLAKLPQVSGVERISANGELRFKVAAERGSDLRERIFDFAVTQRLKLLELNHVSTSLEDVFLKLTRGEPTVDATPPATDQSVQPETAGGGDDE